MSDERKPVLEEVSESELNQLKSQQFWDERAQQTTSPDIMPADQVTFWKARQGEPVLQDVSAEEAKHPEHNLPTGSPPITPDAVAAPYRENFWDRRTTYRQPEFTLAHTPEATGAAVVLPDDAHAEALQTGLLIQRALNTQTQQRTQAEEAQAQEVFARHRASTTAQEQQAQARADDHEAEH